jgi:membrane protease YdiL (CAAX protease family)
VARRAVVAGTVVIGAVLLGLTFARPRDSTSFYVCGFGAAGVWIVGALLAGGFQAGWQQGSPGRPRPVLAPVVAGALAYAAFALAALAAQHLPVLSGAVDGVLGKADAGATWLVLTLAVVSAVAEEVFFRGPLVDALPDRWAAVGATAIYTAVTVATGNVALVATAAVMGALFVLERLSTRGVLASVITHVTWSILMLLALPR